MQKERYLYISAVRIGKIIQTFSFKTAKERKDFSYALLELTDGKAIFAYAKIELERLEK
jgi:hypothetical protein